MTVTIQIKYLAMSAIIFATALASGAGAFAASAEVEALTAGSQIGRQIALGSVSWSRGNPPNSDAVVATIIFLSISCTVTSAFNFRTLEEYTNAFFTIDVGDGCIKDWGTISMHDFENGKQPELKNHFESMPTTNPKNTYQKNVALLRENAVVHLTSSSTSYGHVVVSFEVGEEGKALLE